MSGLSYQKVVDALFAAGMEDAIAIVAQVRRTHHRAPHRRSGRTVTNDDAINIHKLHNATCLNQSQIAARLDLNVGIVSEVLRGKRFPEAAQHYGV